MALQPIDPIAIPQSFTPEATLVIWENRDGIRAMQHPGHAALLLRRYTATDMHAKWIDSRIRYVSFFPGGSRDKSGKRPAQFSAHYFWDMNFEMSDNAQRQLRAGTFQRRPGQKCIQYGDIAESETPVEFFGQMADGIIAFPAMTGTNRHQWGIDLNRIVSWALSFRASREFNYEFISTTSNCAGVAIRALRAGGGEAFASLTGAGLDHTLYVTPKDCIQIGNAVRNGIQLANQCMAYLNREVAPKQASLTGEHATHDVMDLYRAADWKRASAVAFKTRGLILRSIDSALEEYHRHSWDTAYPEKLKAYMTVLKGVHDHFLVSKSGKREQAFIVLATQLLMVWMLQAADVDKAWDPRSYYGGRDPFSGKAERKT